MIGAFLTLVGTFFAEISNSLGKRNVTARIESPYVMGFLNYFWVPIIFFSIAAIKGVFVFSSASLPTFLIRVVLEIAQAHIGILAAIKAERGAVGFLTVATLPLLLFVDASLGYSVSVYEIMGIVLVICAISFLLIKRSVSRDGWPYIAFITVNAVATISLYKYNITHFNSVEAEQGIVCFILLLYFFVASVVVGRENPLPYLLKRQTSGRSVSMGLANILESFAYLFAPAAVITAIKRAGSVGWTIVSGRIFFREPHIADKLLALVLIILGLIFLAQ